MRRVTPDQILDLATYETERDAYRARAMRIKDARRVHVGEHLTFLFENADTIRYQVQEMLRIERRTSAEDVEHEVSTYNELLGPEGGLGCTLLIEVDDEARRDVLLREWRDLPRHLYAELEDGTRVPAIFDERQVGDERVSSVQYLGFDLGGQPPVAIGCDHPGLSERAVLGVDVRAALFQDLRS